MMTGLFETGQREALAESDKWLVAGAIAYSAMGGSIFGHSAYYWLLQRLPVSTVAPSVLLTTVLAVFFSVVFLGEPFGVRMIIGGGVCARRRCGGDFAHRGETGHKSACERARKCSMKFIESPSPNFDVRGRGVDMIILHYTGMASGAEAIARLCDAASQSQRPLCR